MTRCNENRIEVNNWNCSITDILTRILFQTGTFVILIWKYYFIALCGVIVSFSTLKCFKYLRYS